MQIESLINQSSSVGLNHQELAQFLVTWGGATPVGADGQGNGDAEAAQPLDYDQNQVQSDMSDPDAVERSARPKRRAVMPGLPPRVAKWEQMQAGPHRGTK